MLQTLGQYRVDPVSGDGYKSAIGGILRDGPQGVPHSPHTAVDGPDHRNEGTEQ